MNTIAYKGMSDELGKIAAPWQGALGGAALGGLGGAGYMALQERPEDAPEKNWKDYAGAAGVGAGIGAVGGAGLQHAVGRRAAGSVAENIPEPKLLERAEPFIGNRASPKINRTSVDHDTLYTHPAFDLNYQTVTAPTGEEVIGAGSARISASEMPSITPSISGPTIRNRPKVVPPAAATPQKTSDVDEFMSAMRAKKPMDFEF